MSTHEAQSSDEIALDNLQASAETDPATCVNISAGAISVDRMLSQVSIVPVALGELEEAPIQRVSILKAEFANYINERLLAADLPNRRSQKGIVNRTWKGLEALDKSRNETSPEKRIFERAEKIIGVAPPTFDEVIGPRQSRGARHSIIPSCYDRLEGLDMDQAARFLIGLSRKIRKIHGDSPIKRPLGNVVVQNACLPKDSFIGCKLLCDFISLIEVEEGGLPADIDLVALKQAAVDFEELAQQATPQVRLRE